MKGLILLLFIGCLSPVIAQISSAPEYGSLADIKNLSRVYVFSDDLESRDLILEQLAKDPFLKVVGKVEDAEFFIFYGRSFFQTGYSSFGGIFGNLAAGTTIVTQAEIGGVLRFYAW